MFSKGRARGTVVVARGHGEASYTNYRAPPGLRLRVLVFSSHLRTFTRVSPAAARRVPFKLLSSGRGPFTL